MIRKVAQYFPANPARLSSVLRLAILTENFHDMEGYYRVFLKLEQRTDELEKYICSAMVVTGKYYLRQQARSRAMEVFRSAAVTSAGNFQFLVYIVEALLDHGHVSEAGEFVDRLQRLGVGTQSCRVAEFLYAAETDEPSLAVNEGRKLLKDGIESPAIFESLIRCSMKGGYADYAGELTLKAQIKWPHRFDRLRAA